MLADDEGVTIEISNRGQLPAAGAQAEVAARGLPSGTHGLGLVRALLPRRSASFVLAQRGDEVVALVTLRPPGVRRQADPLPAALQPAQPASPPAGP